MERIAPFKTDSGSQGGGTCLSVTFGRWGQDCRFKASLGYRMSENMLGMYEHDPNEDSSY